MGTRALIRVYEGETEILCLYRQMDGYPAGLGKELKEFCDGIRLVNGISGSPEMGEVANGAGCLAAQLVVHLKDGVGSVYVFAPESKGVGEEYEYHVKCGQPLSHTERMLPVLLSFMVRDGNLKPCREEKEGEEDYETRA
jgi:hypothetical protein